MKSKGCKITTHFQTPSPRHIHLSPLLRPQDEAGLTRKFETSHVGGATCRTPSIPRSALEKDPRPRPLFEGNPVDYTVHGILQARMLGCVAVPFSRDLPNPGIEARSPASGGFFTCWAAMETLVWYEHSAKIGQFLPSLPTLIPMLCCSYCSWTFFIISL